jgi:hypothetical protein
VAGAFGAAPGTTCGFGATAGNPPPAFGMLTVGASTAASTDAARPLGTAPNAVLPFDAGGAVVAQLSLGRVVADESPPPLPGSEAFAAATLPHLRRSVVFGLAVETTLTPVPWGPDDETKNEAKALLDAAKESGLVTVYERSASSAHMSETCVICLEENPPADLILLPCKHQCLHGGCINDAMRRCPLCRTRVESTIGRGEDGRLTCKQIGGDDRGRSDLWRTRSSENWLNAHGLYTQPNGGISPLIPT